MVPTYCLSLSLASLCVLGVSAQQSRFEPRNVELDLVFPRNDTYAPLDYFPLIWGLRGTLVSWLHGVILHWSLRQTSNPQPSPFAHGEFSIGPRGDRPTNFVPYVQFGYFPEPMYIYDFPVELRNFTAGHWVLEWRFGFEQNCSLVRPDEDDHYRMMPTQQLVFRVAQDGKMVDLLEDRECRAEGEHAFAFLAVNNTGRYGCPIVENTRPNPCALEFTEAHVGNITARARDLGNCASGNLTEINADCEKSAGVRVTTWTGGLLGLAILWVVGGLL
ncbi:hypothetical protein BJX61DRAFT_548267 [Aspergillus egyptiacus]|nr:hypothetical protein BJX61DRAFT_548267 [Aspergillus egyptiacus]